MRATQYSAIALVGGALLFSALKIQFSADTEDAAPSGLNTRASENNNDAIPTVDIVTEEDTSSIGETPIEPVVSKLGAAVESPLAVYPGFGHDPVSDEAAWRMDVETRELEIKDCMAGRGFDYSPEIPTYVDADEDLTPEELLSLLTEESANETYSASLSDSEQVAYNLALYGVVDPNDESDLNEAIADNCTAQATAKVPGVFAVASSLHDVYAELDEQIEQDLLTDQVESAWSACMFGLGHTFENHVSMFSHIGDVTGENIVEVDGNLIVESTTATEMAGIESDSEGCETSISYHERRQEIRGQYEASFVEQYRDVLEGREVRTPPPKNAF